MNGLVLVAGGSGHRLGAGVPKALVEVAADNLIGHCLRRIEQVHGLHHTVVVAPAEQVAAVTESVSSRFEVTVVAGGPTRDVSVRAGLAALPPATRNVLIHDAARPFTPPEVFEAVLAALVAGAQAVIPALPVVDTIKLVRAGVVQRTVPRDDLVAVQTPQGFHVAALLAAHAAQTADVTDDAMLMEQAGVAVQVVRGSELAFKITTPFDLRVAQAMQEV